MGRSVPVRPYRSRSILHVTIGALAFLAVRPVGPVERAFDLVLGPARVLQELAGPVAWLQSRDVHALEPDQRARADAELEAHRALERAVLEMARPADPALVLGLAERGVRTVRAEVVEHLRDKDRVVVRLEEPAHVRHGLPVVCGDSFVGLVDLETPVDPRRAPQDVEVVLLCSREARIGARVAADQDRLPCELVVGGVTPAAEVRLDVHNPSNRGSTAGEARVWEPSDEGFAYLANGFRLGCLGLDRVPYDGFLPASAARQVLGVIPELDFGSGLYQVLVLLPPNAPAGPGAAAARGSLLEDGDWRACRLAVRGEPSPWRRGRKLLLGRAHGIEEGAAVASGVRFVGRVQHAGWASSDVLLFTDPGFRIPALAMVHDARGERPWVLGEIETVRAVGSAAVSVRWSATLPLSGPGSVPATLWTGSGARGVPRGLLLGTTELPGGAGPHELEIALPDGGEEAARTFVRWKRPAQEGRS